MDESSVSPERPWNGRLPPSRTRPDPIYPADSLGEKPALKPVAPGRVNETSNREGLLPRGPDVHEVRVSRRPTTVDDFLENAKRLKTLLNYVRAGASWSAAAAAVRLDPDVLRRWIVRGSQERSGSYRKLYRKVFSALGEATSVAEIKVAASDPLHWLKYGPGRLINPEWSEAEDGVQDDGSTAPANNGILVMTPDMFAAAVAEMQAAGALRGPSAGVIEGEFSPTPSLTAQAAGEAKPSVAEVLPPGLQSRDFTVEEQALGIRGEQEVDMNDDGEFTYDDDVEEAEDRGVNYAENGNWTSQNPHLPPGLRAGDPKPVPEPTVPKKGDSSLMARLRAEDLRKAQEQTGEVRRLPLPRSRPAGTNDLERLLGDI